jgi:P4 family phage/plasmid primase-like protien
MFTSTKYNKLLLNPYFWVHIQQSSGLETHTSKMEKQTQEKNWKKLDSRIRDIVDLERPVQKTQRISDVAEEYEIFGLGISDIKEEVKRVEKIDKENIKAEKEKELEAEKERKVELKILADKKKANIRAEEDKEKQNAKDQKEAKKNAVKQEVRSKMETDFQYNISTLLATNQENKATELCSQKAQEKHKFYSTKSDVKSELYVYENNGDNEGITIPNGKTLVELLCRSWMGEAYDTRWSSKVIDKIKADNQIDEDIFFNEQSKHKEQIPVKNGILNIFTRELSPFTQDKIFFNKLPLTYNPEAKCPNITKFFKETLNHEQDAKVMEELCGFALLKEYEHEKSFMFVGDGRNGKGKCINLMKRFVGSQNYSSVPLDQFNTSSSGIHEMHGKLINLAGDISSTSLKDTGLLKQLCGRDNINAKRKYLRDLSFENYAKLIFAANELPRVYDFSFGFWSRWILLEFPYTFVSKKEFENTKDKTNIKIADTKIIDKITTDDELSGLLNLALDGLDRLQKNKGFSYSKGTDEVKTMWVRKSDSFTAFCLDHMEESEGQYISKKVLRGAFHKFCRNHKLKGTSDKSIKVTLESLYGVSEERPQLLNGEWAWFGIKFKEEEDGE